LVGVNCEDSDPALYGNGRFDRFGFADDVGSLLYSHCRRPPVPFLLPSSGGLIVDIHTAFPRFRSCCPIMVCSRVQSIVTRPAAAAGFGWEERPRGQKRTGVLIRARQAGRQAPAWMGQNLILLVEERMLDGCLDES
jgi:hypothetical protein